MRQAVVRSFPYVIVYEEHDNDIAVYGFMHCARDPRTWSERRGLGR